MYLPDHDDFFGSGTVAIIALIYSLEYHMGSYLDHYNSYQWYYDTKYIGCHLFDAPYLNGGLNREAAIQFAFLASSR